MAWRFRKCPACAQVMEAGLLLTFVEPGKEWTKGEMRRECPECGWVGATADFRVVHDTERMTPAQIFAKRKKEFAVRWTKIAPTPAVCSVQGHICEKCEGGRMNPEQRRCQA